MSLRLTWTSAYPTRPSPPSSWANTVNRHCARPFGWSLSSGCREKKARVTWGSFEKTVKRRILDEDVIYWHSLYPKFNIISRSRYLNYYSITILHSVTRAQTCTFYSHGRINFHVDQMSDYTRCLNINSNWSLTKEIIERIILSFFFLISNQTY